jgi:hypothetical protein
MVSIESAKEKNDEEQQFKQASIAYMQRLSIEREKTKPKSPNN